ncbi:homeodomain-interacting protein kinase 3-like [Thalassophryne amazonica]|uniref:homeodomain-interacting protein kinase 3-like n=1 Tax=Thalassophryne amazonica TaxID=390379 RepID=UPI0014724048|nr:homeodomain-interacting protein kinase 3-like [Thalassophryne amazonica]
MAYPDEYEDDGDLEHDLRCLNKLIDVYGIEDNAEYEDRKAFVSLLKQLLQLDARQRTTAARALRHPFVTMSHLKKSSSSYVTESRTLMSVCPETIQQLETVRTLVECLKKLIPPVMVGPSVVELQLVGPSVVGLQMVGPSVLELQLW